LDTAPIQEYAQLRVRFTQSTRRHVTPKPDDATSLAAVNRLHQTTAARPVRDGALIADLTQSTASHISYQSKRTRKRSFEAPFAAQVPATTLTGVPVN
jgi:hypothetical protein